MSFDGVELIKALLPLERCKELSHKLKVSVINGETKKDNQCPLSEGIYGAPYFESLLLDLKPTFEQHTGKKLHPTYSYARLYKKGEELKRHIDRESCEISATITLDWEGECWPFFVERDKETYYRVDMQHGDSVIYHGIVPHWREVFNGLWQTQVFLHYVDADGPNASWKFDRRPDLNIV